MAISKELKKFLYHLFPFCFSKELDKKFDICIIEAMPYIAYSIRKLTKDSNTTIKQECIKLKTNIYNLLYNNNSKGISVERGIHILIDNFVCVPGNKSLEERNRDKNQKSCLNEEDYIKLREEKKLKCDELIFNDVNSNITGIDGIILWRDWLLKWNMIYLYSLELSSFNIPENKFIHLDEGIFLNDTYSNIRKQILIKYNFWNNPNISIYEKDALVSFEIVKNFKRALFFPKGKVYYDDSLNIAESDLKIPSLIKRSENNDSYLVISSDSDILLILLLHMKSIINPENFEFDNEVYLDTQCISDQYHDIDREYRFINITLLFKSLIELFKRDYKGIIYPIETFSFLFLSISNDFMENLHNNIGPAKTWDCFSELHCTNPKGYIKFTDNLNKQITRINIKTNNYSEYNGILNNAIILKSYNNNDILDNKINFSINSENNGYFSNFFDFNFDETKILNFFYYIYQQPILNKLNKEKIINSKLPFNNYHSLFKEIDKFNKKLSIPSNNNKKRKFDEFNKSNDIKSIEDSNDNKKQKTINLIKPNELLTRIKSLKWVCNYFQNGWKSNLFWNNYYFEDKDNKSLSMYGWKFKQYFPFFENDLSITSTHVIKTHNNNINFQKKNTILDIINFFTVLKTNASNLIENEVLDLLK